MVKKSTKKASSSSRSIAPVEGFPDVIFKSDDQRERFVNLMGKKIVPTRFIDRRFLLALGLLEPVDALLRDSGMGILRGLREHTYRFLTLEFLSSFHFNPTANAVIFWLLNADIELTTNEFAEIFRFPIDDLQQTSHADFAPEAVWTSITGYRSVNLSSLRVSQVEHPALRYYLRLVAGTFFGRTDPGKINKVDLTILGNSINVQRIEVVELDLGRLVLEHFMNVVTGRISTIAIGGLITKIAKAKMAFNETGHVPLVKSIPLLDKEYLTTKSTKWLEPSGQTFRWLLHSDRRLTFPCADLPPIIFPEEVPEAERGQFHSYTIPIALLYREGVPAQGPYVPQRDPPPFEQTGPSTGPSTSQEQSAPIFQSGPSYEQFTVPDFTAPPSYGQGFDPLSFEARRHGHEMVNQNLLNYNHYSYLLSQGFRNQSGPHPTYWQGQANYPGTIFQEYGVDPTQWCPDYGRSYGGAGGQWLGGAGAGGFGGADVSGGVGDDDEADPNRDGSDNDDDEDMSG